MSDFDWPSGLNYRSIALDLQAAQRSGGASIGGPSQKIYSDTGFWSVAVSGIVIRNRLTANAFRAMLTRLQAGDVVRVPIADPYRPAGSRITGSYLRLAVAAAARATTLAVSAAGIDIEPGQYVSYGHRTHLVTEVTSGGGAAHFNQFVTDSPWDDRVPWVDAAMASTTATLKIQPPLRAPIPAGSDLEIRKPTLRCRIKDEAAGAAACDMLRFASADLALQEAY